MQRYFVADEQWSTETVMLKGEQAHHIVRVMRMSPGDVIICIDEGGQAAYSRLAHVHPDEVTCQVEEWLDADTELAINITVAQGDLKADKYEWVVQKATEMGAVTITNFPADHSVVKWDERKSAKRQARFAKIAREAAGQSERLHIPAIERKESLASLTEEASTYNHLWIISEQSAREGNHYALADALGSVKAAENILLIFGPEGGFSEREHLACTRAGFVPVSLGPRILRAETAPVATLAMLVYHVELKR
ncbi:RsmE family RNA methyltransferase [Natribacillus halophilus]|uniref:Ribosomal RNA small subunit methyltransferase E n=1 Tax=Natribacillus halophilus TaxID=549003 RepID=A0A1G8JTC6_9BACI|nr:RsmE family RNA methyltransferase [Natribacillus halophilus]SDI34357.1 16S rRNA (uracil1498-N3)-methyltransferase [Natribacillus halophilus]